jgi:hypothetical protein
LASVSVIAWPWLAVVVYLCLEGRDGGHERLHLLHHVLILIGRVCYIAEALLHLLFGDVFGCGFGLRGGLDISLGG